MSDPAATAAPRVRAATLAAWAPFVAMALAVLAPRTGLLAPLAGFGAFLIAWALGGLIALVVGLASLRRARRAGAATAAGIKATVVGGVLVAALAAATLTSRAPPIHDITTSPEDPPAFTAAASHPGNAGRDMTYPDGGADVPAIQRSAYPDLRPIRVPLPPADAHAAALRAAGQLGWTVVWSNVAAGALEAYDTTRVFRFVDDVVVRVRPSGDGSVIDVRSTSRVGRSDMGANAARIRAFAEALGQPY